MFAAIATLFLFIWIHVFALFQQAVGDPAASALATQVTAASIGVALIQWLKSSSWFPWLTAESKKLNRIFSLIYAAITAVGIHLAWSHGSVPGTYMLQVTGLTLVGVATAAWAIAKSFVLQELIYRTAANQSSTPAPAAQKVAAQQSKTAGQ